MIYILIRKDINEILKVSRSVKSVKELWQSLPMECYTQVWDEDDNFIKEVGKIGYL